MTPLSHHAMLMATPAVVGNVDTFDTNTIAQYVASVDTGTATWTIGGGTATVSASAGAQGTLTRNLTSTVDGWVEVDIMKANDAGIVGNWQDGSHYLVVTIDDAESDSGNTNLLRLFSRSGGSFTQIGASAAVTFPRGTQHTVRLTRSGTAVSVSFDGATVISGADSANNVAGTRGMRANGNGSNVSSIFNELRWS